MSHRFGDALSHAVRALSLLAALMLSAAPSFAAPAPPDAATETCMHHLQAIGRALNAYQHDHDDLPAHLSDLYPKYLKDKAMLHCPADPTPGDLGYQAGRAPADPNMPVSYLYEMSADPATFNVPFGPAPDGKITWRQQKMAQRDYFGDRLPVVRCWHHYQAAAAQTAVMPALLLSGRVVRTIPAWEADPATVPALLTTLERDLAAGPAQVHRRWPPSDIADYFVGVKPLPALRARLDNDAAKLAAVPGPFPHAGAGDEAAAVASLHGAAGELDRAIAGYEAALDLPGDHDQIAVLISVQSIVAGHPEKGVAALEQLHAREPQNTGYTRLLAACYGSSGQKEKAAAMEARADQQTVGQPAPDFTFKDTTGKTVHLADLRGKPVLLYFWYYPTAPSRAVAPQLEALQKKYQDQGLTVVSLVPGAGQQAIDFAGKTFTYPLLLNAVPAFDSYQVSSVFLPALVLIGPDGKIAARHDGSSPDLATTLEADAKKLLPSVAAAP